MTWRPNLWTPTRGKALLRWLPDDGFAVPQGWWMKQPLDKTIEFSDLLAEHAWQANPKFHWFCQAAAAGRAILLSNAANEFRRRSYS